MQTSINRRTALALASGAAASAAIPAAAGGPPESGLPALIEAHRAAYEVFDRTIEPREKAEDRWSEQARGYTIMVPVPGGALEIQAHSTWYRVREELHAEVQRHFADLERRIPSYASDRIRAELLAEIKQAKRAAYRFAVNALRGIGEAQERAGLVSAVNAYDEAATVTDTASLAVLAYPCKTIAECRLKAEYIEHGKGIKSDLLYDDRVFIEAFLQSFLPEPVIAEG